MQNNDIYQLLGEQADSLLQFSQPKISRDLLHVPGPDFITRVVDQSNRSSAVKANLKRLFSTGRLANTGYVSILPVDQGIEHTAGYSFAPNPIYFDPEAIVKLAYEGGCNAVASTYGALASVSSLYVDKIPFIVKINHNELLTYPTKHDQILFSSAEDAANIGAAGIGATIYFGSAESNRQIVEISREFAKAHALGMFTVLWCYVRNPLFAKDGTNYEAATDITGQANHLGVTMGADIIKQKLPETNYGFKELSFGKQSDELYNSLTSPHPIDLTRYQVANCYMGRVGMISSGGPSGANDLHEAVIAATINKRAGGMGMIVGRKAFSKPFTEGVALLNAIQDVYLAPEITVA